MDPSAFVKAELDSLFKAQGVSSVFLCGLSATACVLATYFGAMERGYTAFMVKDALMSPKAIHTDTLQETVESTGWTVMETLLKSARAGTE